MDTQELVKTFVTAIGTQHWNLCFFRFCEVIGIDPGEDDSGQRLYAFEKFQEFGKLNSALSGLGTDFIVALIDDYISNKNS
ncbi:MAG: hypothetical protein VKK42_25795 [Lyngbya sp.]|nr:hypothetical protein [Lyngbya sp.]